MEHIRQESRSVSIFSALTGLLCLMLWGLVFVKIGPGYSLKSGWGAGLAIACVPLAMSVLFAFIAAFTEED